MKLRLATLFFLIFVSLPFWAYSTHIVGGSITYIHNGGSKYTVTLKLYRDCSPGTAALPDSVIISVVGNDGAPFVPNKDIVIQLGTVTFVPSNLDSCASAPNPMPCTQEAIYTTTVNDLPPNPGGYHLYFQYIARNYSLTNVNAAMNTVGESFYAYIPGTPIVWSEDFSLPNGTTVDNGTSAWTTSAGTIAPALAEVRGNAFQMNGADNAQQTWTSQAINIASFTGGVNLNVNLSENGTLDPGDTISVYYSLNGGPLTLFSTNGQMVDDFGTSMASQSGLVGSSVQIVIQVHYDANSPNSEIYKFDNVSVGGTAFSNNSNPSFTLFPPLFLCVGSPFTFDHSAIDLDGDSLAYSFYTPFDGDNGPGPLDPTFPNNTATFTPITFLPGFTSINPLGGTPLNLNVHSGLLSGTPTSLGQYVVGILVREYRNGVYLSSTYRDFQFNVINCPQFVPALLTPITSCNGNTISFSNQGGGSGTGWLWNFGDPTTLADSSKLNNPTYTYANAGNYQISLTTGVGTPCANTATTQLVISSVKPKFVSSTPRCVGSVINFTDSTAHSSNAPLTSWHWKFGDGTSSTLQNPSHSFANSGTYIVTLIVGSSTNCTDSIKTPITINKTPVANLVSSSTYCTGAISSIINLSSVPAGASFTWANSNSSIGLAASGTGNIPSFTTTNTGLAGAIGNITAIPTLNSCPGNPLNFSITVNPKPTLPALTNQLVCAGTSIVATSFITSPTGASYNWTNTNSAIGLALTGNGNLPAFTATNTTNAAISSTISIVPTLNSCVGNTVAYTFTVNPKPFLANPVNQQLCAGTLLPAINLSSIPAGATFSWTNSDAAIGLVASGSGNIPAFTATNTGSTNLIGNISIVPTLNGCIGAPASYQINVNPTPSFAAPANQSICAGDAVTGVVLSSIPPNATFTWTNNNTAIGLAASGTGNIPAFTAINSGTSVVAASITIAISLNSCPGLAQSYALTIKPIPVLAATSNLSVCPNEAVPASSFSTSPAGATFSWTNSNSSIGLAASGTGMVPAFVAFNSGSGLQTANIIITPTLNGCSGNSGNYSIDVKPQPQIIAPSNSIVCPGNTMSASVFTSNPPGANFTWTNSNPAIGLGASGSGNIAPFNSTNPSLTAIVGTITVVASLNVCLSPPTNFSITVQPKAIVAVPSDISVCAEEIISSTSFSGIPSSSTYTWTNSNTLIGLAPNGIGNLPQFNAINPSGFVQTANIIVTPTYQGCIGTPASYDITVLPKPIANFTYTPNPTTVLNPTIEFMQNCDFADSFEWSFGDGGTSVESNPRHSYVDTGCVDVQLVARNLAGCSSTTLQKVCINGDFVIYIPNAFTPDGDGINDFFFPKGYGITSKDYSLSIFDRWGLLLFKSNLLEKGWNGSSNNFLSNGVSPIDTYIYKLHCTDIFGLEHDFIGQVNLVR